ncbi:2Fe-2S iron-sulfur cluster binding domain-containing protein [Pseudomonas sp. PB120]|uniref:FAD-binding oxidoreductase n=1 Tax=Pseudomonas sp. PB120 TaxID=2494700 RepID=UPI0012FD3A0E|nr:FAD-binding oxidoreductase [Pseudomonas sp. PB120]MVV49825.1 2Fe-2S iron-sulfur cluster binding domain-containing protein [Pseudomonas sp. PB120]
MGTQLQTPSASTGFKTFRVMEKIQESAVITSFVLTATDGFSTLRFRPGQFLIVRLPLGDGVTALRNYSLSGDANDPSRLRISVKREPAPFDRPELPPGQGSNHLHDAVQVGDSLEIAGPTGTFVLDEESPRPVVLFSGGVGLTPMLSMLHQLSRHSSRPVFFIHACESGTVHAFRDEVLALASRRPGIHVHFCYRNPEADDLAKGVFHSQGLVSRETLQRLLPLDDYDVYLCGPRLFMQANWRLLRDLGIASQRIHYEFFGPATVLEEDEVIATAPLATPEPTAPVEGALTVEFLPSGTRVAWDESCQSLLELAEQAGLTPAFNCRAGLCNTCQVSLREGSVEYVETPLDEPQSGSILLCCTRPTSAVTVDLRQ